MKLYKLTKQNNTTYHGIMSWEVGKTNKVKPCKNPELCSKDVIHAYKNINLAFLLNPIHGQIDNPKIYEAKGKIQIEDYGKVGVFELELIKKLEYPKWYKDVALRNKVQVQFAVLCAESVLSVWKIYNKNDKRPHKAIEEAKKYLKSNFNVEAAAYATAKAAAYATAKAADDAARAAAYTTAKAAAYTTAKAADDAARAAAYAARAAYATAYATARAAAYAARAADDAARAAYDAARAAAYTTAKAAWSNKIDFCKLADKAVNIVLKGE